MLQVLLVVVDRLWVPTVLSLHTAARLYPSNQEAALGETDVTLWEL